MLVRCQWMWILTMSMNTDRSLSQSGMGTVIGDSCGSRYRPGHPSPGLCVDGCRLTPVPENDFVEWAISSASPPLGAGPQPMPGWWQVTKVLQEQLDSSPRSQAEGDAHQICRPAWLLAQVPLLPHFLPGSSRVQSFDKSPAQQTPLGFRVWALRPKMVSTRTAQWNPLDRGVWPRAPKTHTSMFPAARIRPGIPAAHQQHDGEVTVSSPSANAHDNHTQHACLPPNLMMSKRSRAQNKASSLITFA